MLRSQSGHAPPQLLRARRSTSSMTFRRRRPSVSALSSELHAARRRSSASTPSSAALTATTSPRPMQSGTSSTPAPSGQRRTGQARLMRERRRARPCSAHSAATRRATLSQRLSRWTFGVAPLHPAQPRCSSTPARPGCALTTAPCCTPCVNCRWMDQSSWSCASSDQSSLPRTGCSASGRIGSRRTTRTRRGWSLQCLTARRRRFSTRDGPFDRQWSANASPTSRRPSWWRFSTGQTASARRRPSRCSNKGSPHARAALRASIG
mmetsp:Transcript_2326/g.6921  ORF Transcript_2326/g.6921 Transcript_2326/m.6921 type:complete len:265 (+) Transcript_2326:128-922(+)